MAAPALPGPGDGPRYPELRVSIRSTNPLALVAAIREELRLAGAGGDDIARFTSEALADPGDAGHVLEVAEDWVGAAEIGAHQILTRSGLGRPAGGRRAAPARRSPGR